MEKLSQISKLVGVLVEHQNFLEPFSKKDRQWVIQHPKEAIGLFMQAVQDRNSRTIPSLSATMPKVFHLVIDYGMSLEQMIAAGRYDSVGKDINKKNFPILGKGIIKCEACYFCFNGISATEAIEKIEATDKDHPWFPAKIDHLLSLAVTFPEEQHKYPIIGLGSYVDVDICRGDSSGRGSLSLKKAPLLSWDASARKLDCISIESKKIDHTFRFLAVRRVSAL